MNYQLGQYIRTGDNRIGQLISFNGEHYRLENKLWFARLASVGNKQCCLYDSHHLSGLGKSDPRMLIQEHDIIRYTAGSHSLVDEVRRIEDNIVYMKSGSTTFEFITEIWTKQGANTMKCEWRY